VKFPDKRRADLRYRLSSGHRAAATVAEVAVVAAAEPVEGAAVEGAHRQKRLAAPAEGAAKETVEKDKGGKKPEAAEKKRK